MPALIKTPKEEELWGNAKKAVTRNAHIPESKFTEKHWSLVNALFQNIKNNKKVKETK